MERAEVVERHARLGGGAALARGACPRGRLGEDVVGALHLARFHERPAAREQCGQADRVIQRVEATRFDRAGSMPPTASPRPSARRPAASRWDAARVSSSRPRFVSGPTGEATGRLLEVVPDDLLELLASSSSQSGERRAGRPAAPSERGSYAASRMSMCRKRNRPRLPREADQLLADERGQLASR